MEEKSQVTCHPDFPGTDNHGHIHAQDEIFFFFYVFLFGNLELTCMKVGVFCFNFQVRTEIFYHKNVVKVMNENIVSLERCPCCG